MDGRQRRICPEALGLRTERLGALPVVNHFLERLRLESHLEAFVSTDDRRIRMPYAKALGVLVRSLLLEREPMYRQHETVSRFAPWAFGQDEALAEHLSDDAVGRALDRLFDADRVALLSAVVVPAVDAFGLAPSELHNDSTTVKFCGQYGQARGRRLRGKRAPWITCGYSKDHRPDLKQLRRGNLHKHGVDFADAVEVFYDDLACAMEDPDHHDEQRFVLIGIDAFQRVLVVAYTQPDEQTICVISARPASAAERRHYEQG